MPGLPAHGPDAKSGAENFYYGDAADTTYPSTSGYPPPGMDRGITSPVYPPHAQRGPPVNDSRNPAWSQNPYPTLGSPSIASGTMSGNHAAPGPPQHYATLPDQDPNKAQYPEAPYQPSLVLRRDSHYQPSAPEPHSPEKIQSPTYATIPPAGPALHQQPTGPPSQSYYYQPQQTSTMQSGYPPLTTGQPGPYPDAGQPQTPASHPPAPPVEESLIEL